MRSFKHIRIIFCITALDLMIPDPAAGGPPFLTDDPEPVDYMHWEFYIASQQEYHAHDAAITLPHVEINFGAMENLQAHLVLPMSFVRSQGENQYGYSDTEFGIKYRFIQEDESTPQIGVFPMMEIPTASDVISPGQNQTQIYLPIWFQKSWGKLTTYGGSGWWYNPGEGNKNWIFAGWEAQYDFSPSLTLGGEFYYHTAESTDGTQSFGFSLGGYFNLTRHDHILFSFGRSVTGPLTFTAYAGYQYTI